MTEIETIQCSPGCKRGAYRSADGTNRCIGCGLVAPSDCNCTADATIWKILGDPAFDSDICLCEHERGEHDGGSGPCEANGAFRNTRCSCPAFKE